MCSVAPGTVQFPDSFAVSGGGGLMQHLGIRTAHTQGVSGLLPSGAGGFLRNSGRVCEYLRVSRVDVSITCSTVLTLFSLPISPNSQLSPLLCIFFTEQLAVRC